jgi:protein-tyrosine phosphatase
MTLTDRTPEWIELEGAVNARAVVPGALLRSDNLQGLTEHDIRILVDDQGLELVLDLRTGNEVRLEGPGPMTREPGVRIEHRSLYPEHGNTDVDIEDAVRPWGPLDDSEFPDETPSAPTWRTWSAARTPSRSRCGR